MNERMKQLADEAGLRFTQLMSNPMVPVVDGKETDLAKFAELIVLKCAEIADTAEPFLASDLIKQHFGVEE